MFTYNKKLITLDENNKVFYFIILERVVQKTRKRVIIEAKKFQ